MLPLHTRGEVSGELQDVVHKVLELDEALRTQIPKNQVLIDLRSGVDEVDENALAEFGFAGKIARSVDNSRKLPTIHSLRSDDVVSAGDAIRVRRGGQISVLYRRKSSANTLFVTERCNSLCLMCSQPPRDDDDSWRIDEILKLLPLIDKDIPVLGITGGEPTLLGPSLREIISRVHLELPQTDLHILTNGRRFAENRFADEFALACGWTKWAIPIYADTAPHHDYVVQAQGAFEESLNGIYNLAERGHRIEIRCVLHAQTIGRLPQLAEFLWRNMPFVAHVALMGMEPMGYAKGNRDLLWVDPVDYAETLTRAAWYLQDRGIPTSIYNVPLCVLPKNAWELARQSISDWKITFAPACLDCDVRAKCCGFFQSAGAEWQSKGIHPIREESCT
jgi:His-Xaa-Ser system radical SAM maturase HxsC